MLVWNILDIKSYMHAYIHPIDHISKIYLLLSFEHIHYDMTALTCVTRHTLRFTACNYIEVENKARQLHRFQKLLYNLVHSIIYR